ncbi:serine/arginine repetitive matrix protein 3-like [Leopardus geoffroyi]|uniref:serine/arginine repetitive matrix protein 3-like n=1 Tax=Leopardus geoffroyi TaxID=46844 RepID=UPI001E25FD5F|nr:serine/arginine repetitive matrix protein 3-like [Leopardus geoffroyi]
MEKTASRKGRGAPLPSCPRARSTRSQTHSQEETRRKRRAGCAGWRPPRPHRGPRRNDRPQVSLGNAAHRDGGRAGRGPAEQATPRGVLGPARPPGSQRVKRGDKGGPGSGPHPSQHGGARADTAGGSTLPQHTSPDPHGSPPFTPPSASVSPPPARQPPYPVPQSTTQAGSRPAIFLLACCCRCRRLLRADWGQGLAAGDRSYLTIHSRAALSVRGGAGKPKQ